MRKIVLVFPFLFLAFATFAQDQAVADLQAQASKSIKKDPADTSKKLWKKGGAYNLGASLATLNNWAAGGEDLSVSVNSFLNLFAFYQKGKYSWDNNFDYNLGYIKTTTLGDRKNDDRFDFLSKYGYALNPKLNVAGLFNLRSQLLQGYAYTGAVKTLTSSFMSPGYVLISAGLDYKPTSNLSVFFSPITARWVTVSNSKLSPKGFYGVPAGKKSNFEFGAFASVNFMKEIAKNISYKTKLDLFSNYKRNPQNVDVYFTNMLSAKLTKALSATWGLDFIYDDDVRQFGALNKAPGLQFKSVVGLGLQAKF